MAAAGAGTHSVQSVEEALSLLRLGVANRATGVASCPVFLFKGCQQRTDPLEQVSTAADR